MPHKQKRSDKQIIDAIRKADGLLEVAARRLRISGQTIRNRMAKNPKIGEVLKECREFILDTAERKLFEAIRAREPWAVSMVLKTIGKHRGYVERNDPGLNLNLTTADLARMTDEELEQHIARVGACIGRT